MKKLLSAILAAAMLMSLAACGAATGGDTLEPDVDLDAFWTQLESDYEMPAMIESTDDIIEMYYFGLADIALSQSVIKVPMMSSVVSEYVFVRCEKAQDAAAVAEILQARVDDQAAGGAWYPDSVAAWGTAQVLTNGSYVAMIAAGDNTAAIADAWNALFE